MVCIYCGGSTQVINSRLQKKLNRVWRRRTCVECHNTFTTSEAPLEYLALLVDDTTGASAPFSRDMLFLSIYDSCRHRKTAMRDASALADAITSQLLQTDHQGRLSRSAIQEAVYEALQRFDQIAAVHYGAYYFPSRG